ncbi:MAG: DUF5777 family beta-barrel protein, partial [Bacteroidota bacterium]
LSVCANPDSLKTTVKDSVEIEPVSKLILSEGTSVLNKKSIQFFIDRRFDWINVKGSAHTFFGVDIPNDYRIGLNYGLTNKIQLGISRSKNNEIFEGVLKLQLLKQSAEKKIPVTVVGLLSAGITAKSKKELYPEGAVINQFGSLAHRMVYFSKIIVSRNFSKKLYSHIFFGLHHRNLIIKDSNRINEALDRNGIIFAGTGLAFKVNKKISLIADYYHVFSSFRKDNPNFLYGNPFSFGVSFSGRNYNFLCSFSNSVSASGINFVSNENGGRFLAGKFNLGISLIKTFRL